jgi:hypothetical protein
LARLEKIVENKSPGSERISLIVVELWRVDRVDTGNVCVE